MKTVAQQMMEAQQEVQAEQLEKNYDELIISLKAKSVRQEREAEEMFLNSLDERE